MTLAMGDMFPGDGALTGSAFDCFVWPPFDTDVGGGWSFTSVAPAHVCAHEQTPRSVKNTDWRLFQFPPSNVSQPLSLLLPCVKLLAMPSCIYHDLGGVGACQSWILIGQCLRDAGRSAYLHKQQVVPKSPIYNSSSRGRLGMLVECWLGRG